MKTLMRDLDNMVYRKRASQSVSADAYAEAYAQYFVSKRKRHADLSAACEVFNQAYELRNNSGVLVNDLQIMRQDGVRVTVRKANGDIYPCINLATNSYNDLDLEARPRQRLGEYVQSAALSSCLSRKIAGRLSIHQELEEEISDFMDYEACVLATCGYIAQQSVMTSLFHEGDVIFSDQHNHSSLVDGMAISKARVIVYPHLDYDALEKLVEKCRGKYNAAGIVSDGVFSAHGTLANLSRIAEIRNRHNLISVIDDTHGFLAIGDRGRGCVDYFHEAPDVVTASLAKGLAGYGGMIVGRRAVIRTIDCHGRQNINTSHLSPIVAAQSLYNLQDFRQNQSRYQNQLKAVLRRFNARLTQLGIPQYPDPDQYLHPIFSFEGEDEAQVLKVFQGLLEHGFLGAMFPPPVAPKPTIRFSLHRCVDSTLLDQLALLMKASGMQPLTRQFWPNLRSQNSHFQKLRIEEAYAS